MGVDLDTINLLASLKRETETMQRDPDEQRMLDEKDAWAQRHAPQGHADLLDEISVQQGVKMVPTREIPQPAGIPTREVGQQRRDGRRRMTFGEAIDYTRTGAKVARDGWNGKDMWIALQEPDANSKMTLPYLYMRTAQGDLVPWLASQTDMLARDWVVVS